MWKSLVIHPPVCIAHAPCIIWNTQRKQEMEVVGVGLAWVACGSVSCQQSVVKKHVCLSSSPALGVCVHTTGQLTALLSLSFPIYKMGR